jgi:hypothetical protein
MSAPPELTLCATVSLPLQEMIVAAAALSHKRAEVARAIPVAEVQGHDLAAAQMRIFRDQLDEVLDCLRAAAREAGWPIERLFGAGPHA